jgi:outer membrane protein assembly factor BamB
MRTSIILAAAGCLAAGIAGAPAQDWPQFRGPSGDGHATAKNLPLKWTKEENIAWHVTLPGKGWSSPVLGDQRIFLTAAVLKTGATEGDPRADRSLRALCLDAVSGKTIWDVEVFAQSGGKAPGGIHQKNSHASPTPVLHNGRLYVHFGHQGTACLDPKTGKTLWTNRQLYYEPQHGNGSSPIIAGDFLVFSCDGREEQFVAALRLTDGTVAWKFKRQTSAQKKFAFCTPEIITVNGRKMIITPGADVVHAIDPLNGSEIWRCRYEGYSVVPKPVFGNGLVYIATSFDTPDLLAIKPDGKGDVTETHVAWEINQDKRPPKTASMILDGANLFWVSDNGIATCADAKTGEIVWSERVGRDTSASPILAEGKLYFLDEAGLCTVVAAEREFKKLAESELTGERTLASLAAVDGALFLRTETGLYRIGKP